MFAWNKKEGEKAARARAQRDSLHAAGQVGERAGVAGSSDHGNPEVDRTDPEALRAKALGRLASDLEQWPLSSKEEEAEIQRKIKEMKDSEKHERLMKVGGAPASRGQKRARSCADVCASCVAGVPQSDKQYRNRFLKQEQMKSQAVAQGTSVRGRGHLPNLPRSAAEPCLLPHVPPRVHTRRSISWPRSLCAGPRIRNSAAQQENGRT